jgi:hypothetical protein
MKIILNKQTEKILPLEIIIIQGIPRSLLRRRSHANAHK